MVERRWHTVKRCCSTGYESRTHNRRHGRVLGTGPSKLSGLGGEWNGEVISHAPIRKLLATPTTPSPLPPRHENRSFRLPVFLVTVPRWQRVCASQVPYMTVQLLPPHCISILARSTRRDRKQVEAAAPVLRAAGSKSIKATRQPRNRSRGKRIKTGPIFIPQPTVLRTSTVL